MIKYVNEQMQESNVDFKIKNCNALDSEAVDKVIDTSLC
jgi:hypothetical protein